MDGRLAHSRIVFRGAFFAVALLILSLLVSSTPRGATMGTWVIEDETVVIADQTLFHEGNIVIQGTGQLVIRNSTLWITQLVSWQFYIRVQDAGLLVLNGSSLESKYPLRIQLFDSSRLISENSVAPRADIAAESSGSIDSKFTSFFGAVLFKSVTSIFVNCTLGDISVQGDAVLNCSNCETGKVQYQDQALVIINTSSIERIICDGVKGANFSFSDIGPVRCYYSAQVRITQCNLSEFRYADDSQATIIQSSIGLLDATGQLPLELREITVENATVRGTANVSMYDCSIGKMKVLQYSTVNLYNSSCDDFLATELTEVVIKGSSSKNCTFIDCVITQLVKANITWATFDYLEISHSTQAQINDTYAYYFHNWCYGTCSLAFARCVFYNMRMSGSVTAQMVNSTVQNWCNVGWGAILNATSSNFLHELSYYENSRGYLLNCTVNPLRPIHESQIITQNCTISIWILDYRERLAVIDSLPLGYTSYWHSNESNCIQGVWWNLTAIDTTITYWDIQLRWENNFLVRNSSIRYLSAYQQSNVEGQNLIIERFYAQHNTHCFVYNSSIVQLQATGSGFCYFHNCTINLIHVLNDFTARFHNCTIETSYSSYNALTIFNHTDVNYYSANSYARTEFYNSEIYRLNAWAYSTYYFWNSVGTWRIGLHDSCYGEFYNSTFYNLDGLYSAVLHVESCSVTNLRSTQSAIITVNNSNIEILSGYDDSLIDIVHNLTGLTSFWIQDSAKITRVFELRVIDQLGNPVESAIVQIYTQGDVLLLSRVTNSDGWSSFRLFFLAHNRTLLDTYRLFVSFSSVNESLFFNSTSLQPFFMVLDLGGSPPTEMSLPDAITLLDSTSTDIFEECHYRLNITITPAQNWLFSLSGILILPLVLILTKKIPKNIRK
jgi:hypothetical protein